MIRFDDIPRHIDVPGRAAPAHRKQFPPACKSFREPGGVTRRCASTHLPEHLFLLFPALFILSPSRRFPKILVALNRRCRIAGPIHALVGLTASILGKNLTLGKFSKSESCVQIKHFNSDMSRSGISSIRPSYSIIFIFWLFC
jgi:hypothetical protein